MDHVPELWKELRLEFKDNSCKKYEEPYDPLLEEGRPINRLNTIRNGGLNLVETGLCKIAKKPEKMENKLSRRAAAVEILKKPTPLEITLEEIVKTKSENKGKNYLKKIHCIIC